MFFFALNRWLLASTCVLLQGAALQMTYGVSTAIHNGSRTNFADSSIKAKSRSNAFIRGPVGWVESTFGSDKKKLQEEEEKREEKVKEAAHHDFEVTEKHEEVTDVGTALSVALFGMLFFNMSLFYLVNHPDEEIRQSTWACLSATISIFCAVLIWRSMKALMNDFLSFVRGPTEKHEDLLPHARGDVIIPIIQFLVVFLLVQWLLIKIKHNKNWVIALAMIGAHIMGFSAVDAFSAFMHTPPWRDEPYFAALSVLIVAAFLLVLFHTTDRFRKSMSEEDSDSKYMDQVELWWEACCESENECAGFTLGLLASLMIRYFITGELEPTEGYPWGKTGVEVLQLLFAALFCAWLVQYIKRSTEVEAPRSPKGTEHAKEKASTSGDLVNGRSSANYSTEDNATFCSQQFWERVVEIGQTTVSMTFGWCFLYVGRWTFWVETHDKGLGDGDLVLARITQALAMSFTIFLGIFVIDFFADQMQDQRGMRALQGSFGLVVGLSWEAAFTPAMACISKNAGTEQHRNMLSHALAVAVCVVVLPAWKLYILKNHKGHNEDPEDDGSDSG